MIFILLTNFDNGRNICVSVDHILSIEAKFKTGSTIYLRDKWAIDVNESIEEIMKLIGGVT